MSQRNSGYIRKRGRPLRDPGLGNGDLAWLSFPPASGSILEPEAGSGQMVECSRINSGCLHLTFPKAWTFRRWKCPARRFGARHRH